MSAGERDAVTGLISTLIVILIFWTRLSGQFEAGLFTGEDALKLWARSVLTLIGIGIVVAIVVTILFTILHTMVYGEAETKDARDERDTAIDRRAMYFGHWIVSLGILGVIVDLAFGASALRAMTLILVISGASEVFKDSFKLYCYRRGL